MLENLNFDFNQVESQQCVWKKFSEKVIDDIRYVILSRKISILSCGGAHTAPSAHIRAVGPGGRGEDYPP